MVIKLVAKQAEGAGYRRAGHIDESAVTLASIEVEDLLKLIEKSGFGFPLVNALQHDAEHRCLHATRGTLAARLAGKELRNAKRFVHHAVVFRIEAHHAATE
jgi:hypothetical protein